MSRTSAGVLFFRRKPHLQLLLAHPGSPLWQDKDEGGWIIPTGRVKDGEQPLERARQELEEVFGFVPDGNYLELGSVTEEETGESIQMWAVEYNLPEEFVFEPFWFEMEWPPDSGQFESFPEMDRIEYFNPFEARKKILPSQRAFISRLIDACSRTERE